jgi:dolichyl-phosphate beta-glucosyltransferase
MTQEAIDLSIILPSYMEAKNIGGSLEQLAAFLATRSYGTVEVLVIVAESPDGTAAIAQTKAKLFTHFRVIHAGPRAGKGRDVRIGMFEARGRYRLFMDADLATPLKHLDDVKQFMDHGGSVGIAVRDLIKIHKGFVRKLITGAGNLLAQIILLPGLKDTQCGFKVFEASAAEAIFGRLTILGWGFDLEILAVARKLGYRIDTFDAPDWTDPKANEAGLTGDSPIKASLQVFRDLLTVRFNIIRGRYRRVLYQHKAIYS